jgi:ABC-2 type transport system permease protein
MLPSHLERMLWYKAWHESRVRFLLCALAVIGFSAFAVLSHAAWGPHAALPLTRRASSFAEHIYDLVYSGTLKGVFAVLVLFLALGGLMRERTNRTVLFTLALPVRRTQVLVAEMIVGLAEMSVLALLPAVVVPSLSLVFGEQYPVLQALHFSLLWMSGGAVIFGATYLLSVLLSGTYTALIAGYIALSLHTVVAEWAPLRPYRVNIMWMMGDFGQIRWNDSHTQLLVSPFPIARMVTLAAIALLLLWAASAVTTRQDF